MTPPEYEYRIESEPIGGRFRARCVIRNTTDPEWLNMGSPPWYMARTRERAEAKARRDGYAHHREQERLKERGRGHEEHRLCVECGMSLPLTFGDRCPCGNALATRQETP